MTVKLLDLRAEGPLERSERGPSAPRRVRWGVGGFSEAAVAGRFLRLCLRGSCRLHLQDVHMVGEAVEQGGLLTLESEGSRSIPGTQVAGHHGCNLARSAG